MLSEQDKRYWAIYPTKQIKLFTLQFFVNLLIKPFHEKNHTFLFYYSDYW